MLRTLKRSRRTSLRKIRSQWSSQARRPLTLTPRVATLHAAFCGWLGSFLTVLSFATKPARGLYGWPGCPLTVLRSASKYGRSLHGWCGCRTPGGLLHPCGRYRYLILWTTSLATKLQCRVLRMRCLERSELVKLGCVLEESETNWAIAQFSSRASSTIDSTCEGVCVWKTCACV